MVFFLYVEINATIIVAIEIIDAPCLYDIINKLYYLLNIWKKHACSKISYLSCAIFINDTAGFLCKNIIY